MADATDKMREALKCLLALHDNRVDTADAWNTTMEEARAALAQQPAQGEAVACWIDFPEQVPDPDTECLVEVAFNGERYRAVDTWEMQSEAPLEWSSATVQTGYDWSSHPGDVQRWIPISSITAPPAPGVSVPMAPPAVFAEWLRSNMPPDTIISDPDWWAMAIWSAARRAINAAPAASGGKASVPDDVAKDAARYRAFRDDPRCAGIESLFWREWDNAIDTVIAAAPEPPR